jgi:hypothetical protein
MPRFTPGATSQSVFFYFRGLDGQPKPGLTAGSPGAQSHYTRMGGSSTPFALSDLPSPTAAWQSGGFIETDTGVYRLDVPDAALAAGVAQLAISLQFSNTLGDAVLVELVPSSSVAGAGGTPYTLTITDQATALPVQGASVWVTTDPAGANVAAGALPTNSSGQVTLQLDPGTNYLWVRKSGYASTNGSPITVGTTPGGSGVSMVPSSAPVGIDQGVPHNPRVTYGDLVERLLDYLGADAGENAFRIARRSAIDGYRELTTAHKWTTLQQWGDMVLNGIFTGDGATIVYDHAGGAYPRMMTLSAGAWPAWVNYGYVRVGTVNYPVDRRISDTVVTLDAAINPGSDLAAGTSFTLARDTYTLPADFVAADNPQAENNWGGLEYVRNQEWFATVSNVESYGQPHFFTLTGDPDVPGRIAMRVYPVPNQDQHLRFLYQRKPRSLLVVNYAAGKATVDALGSPLTVSFAGATLTPFMTGCVVRLSPDATHAPTGPEGLTPAALERTIVMVTSTTTATLDEPADVSLTNVLYSISDPLDYEDLALNALYRCCEKQEAIQRLMDTAATANAAYVQALLLAKEAEARVMSRRSAGVWTGRYRQRLRDMPRGPDIS